MRQAGIIAAGALYALEHNVERLAEDHANAGRLAAGLAEMPGITIDPGSVETNLVFFEVGSPFESADQFCEELHAEGVWMLAENDRRARAVTHLDVSSEDIERAITLIARFVRSKR